MTTAPLLIEIGCEEIPAGVAPVALDALRDAIVRTLADHGIAHAQTATALGTPRRLIVHVAAVALQQPDRTDTVLGPPARAARDASGDWTPAALGFARGQGADVAALRLIETPKGPYVGLDKAIVGRQTAAVLAEALPALLRGLPLPKRMRWGREREPFVRPIHWMAALLGDEVIGFDFADVRSGRQVHGHRFLHAGAVEASADLATHLAALRGAGVEPDPSIRKALILQGIESIAREVGGTWATDETTLGVVTWLVEQPGPLLGHFDPAFLAIPAAAIQATLRENQKLFTMRGPDGALLPVFVAVANTLTPSSRPTIAAGNARVVSARLADAAFFVKEDLRMPLAERAAILGRRTWLQGMGSVGAKAERVRRLAARLAAQLHPAAAVDIDRAAQLAKCDLATRMVFEFPELQGTIGADYARRQGEATAVADAIDDHYRPRFAGDELPRSGVGSVLALADKLDTLAAGFALGLQPTGSQDPYALRRTALGTLRLLGETRWPSTARPSLRAAVDLAWDEVRRDVVGCARPGADAPVDDQTGFDPSVGARTDTAGRVIEFLRGRLEALHAATFPTDLVDAVLAADFDRVDAVLPRLRALDARRSEPEYLPLSIAFRRVANLVRKAGPDATADAVDPDGLQADVERDLLDAVATASARVAACVQAEAWTGALDEMARVKPAVDAFFDGVLVMADDLAVRRNRLALLRECAHLFEPIADFGRLQG